MTIRQRILSIISAGIIALIVVLYLTSQIILGNSFAALEKQDTQRDVGRALDALSSSLASLSSKAGDWANWDDAYDFMADPNADFIETNATDTSFLQLQLDLILFVRPSGEVIFSKAFDLKARQEVSVPASLLAQLADPRYASRLLQNQSPESSLTGIVLLPEGPLLIAARPILTSQGEGPIRGTLIFGRYLDDSEVEHLGQITHLSLTVYPDADSQLPPDFQVARAVLAAGSTTYIQALDENSIAGYALLTDVYGRPALLLRVLRARDVYQEGQGSIRYFLLWLSGIGLAFGVVAYVISDRLFLSFKAEQTRREELAALYALSRALGDTADLDDILHLVTRHAVETLHVTFARLVLLEDSTLVLRAAYPIRILDRDLGVGCRADLKAYPVCQRILEENIPTILRPADPDLIQSESDALFLGIANTLCLVPLRVGERDMGLLMLGEARHEEREHFTPEKLRLARSIGEQTASALRRAELFTEMERAYVQTVLALANTVDAKDTYIADHAGRLANLALAIGRELGLGERELEDLRYGAILHDIGKIGVPDAILKKPGALDEREWPLMWQHPLIGEQILTPVSRLAGAARIVRHHHERYDGGGYPDGLGGQNIPLGARILAAVDSYSAMIDKRTYKEARSQEEAISELQRCAGTQFDPQVVEVFLRLLANS